MISLLFSLRTIIPVRFAKRLPSTSSCGSRRAALHANLGFLVFSADFSGRPNCQSNEISTMDMVIYDWFMIDLWLIYDWFMIDLWLIYDWCMIDLWLSYDWFMIDLWLIYDWFMIDLWLIYDWFMIDLWLIYDFHGALWCFINWSSS